jgi:hypothetical protein
MCTRPDAAGSDQKSVSIPIPKAAPAFQTISRHASLRGGFLFHARNAHGSLNSPGVLVRLNHVPRVIVNANHGMM